MALEEALKLFEEGTQITRFCSTKLDEAERKVEILLKNKKEQLTEQSFQIEDDQNQS